jgi:hypothetical protein
MRARTKQLSRLGRIFAEPPDRPSPEDGRSGRDTKARASRRSGCHLARRTRRMGARPRAERQRPDDERPWTDALGQAATLTRRVHLLSRPIFADHCWPSASGRNSSWPRRAVAEGPDSPNRCPERREQRRAPAERGWCPPSRARSTCPGHLPSNSPDRIPGGGRHPVASSRPSSYCSCSRRVARRALMIRTRSPRSVCATNRTWCRADRPIVIDRSSVRE